jgi:outer membrane receptor for ferrienterochelin and colicins
MKPFLLLTGLLLLAHTAFPQRVISGRVLHAQTREPLAGASVAASHNSHTVIADQKGFFSVTVNEADTLLFSVAGFEEKRLPVSVKNSVEILLMPLQQEMDAVVVTGTLKPVRRSESPVAVEVFTPQFFKKNPAPSIFESLQQVNGVRPQLNCSVCNTGDIHINGLEGPYTMVTIDGMPVVSSLASVYGLFGIPTQLIERVEIVKGPASGLYGSEAIGGLINIITRSPEKAPKATLHLMSTSWQEHNLDAGFTFRPGKKIQALLGVNYFNYQQPLDKNKDGFTDVTLQHRVSVFNKLSFIRRQNRTASLAARYFYEDRWGGEMNWNASFRGGDSVYGESIYTKRWELLGNYQLPVKEKLMASFSATRHDQNAFYGTTPYKGIQNIFFSQLTWEKQLRPAHAMLAGMNARYNYYDDNSTATTDTLTAQNKADEYILPGIFVQDEWQLHPRHLLLLGVRLDHHPVHKAIFTPRLAWKWKLNAQQIFRLNTGTGFRVVSLFTEEHAALTGARAVEVLETLKPERSYNINLNYTWFKKWPHFSLNLDGSAWYSHFFNQIIPDYDTDPNKIIYQNLNGYASSTGMTLNLEINKGNRLKAMMGVTLQQVQKTERNAQGEKKVSLPVLTEKWSGTWTITGTFPAAGINIDYTGNIYGPMRLPLIAAADPRPAYSPVWSIQNLQCSKMVSGKWEFFAGIKNLLNWTPSKGVPFIIARANDPFDKKLQYDASGNILATPDNPYALSFDPSYVYAPNQGRRGFAGLRFTLR